LPSLRYLVIDADGQRIGRFESSKLEWKPGDVFDLDGHSWRIVEILPEVSTMVAYNAVWVAAPT
jgi:Lhr-like helicase